MDVGSPERFEIELVEQAPKRSRVRHRPQPDAARIGPPAEVFVPPGGDVVFTSSAPPDQPSGSGDRNRLVVTALAAGAVALFLGWSLGRAGGGGDDAAQTGATSAPTAAPGDTAGEADAATATTVAAGDTLPAATLPPTTRPRPTTTTTLPPAWVESQVTLDARLADQADRLVMVGAAGEVVTLDLATATLARLDGMRPRSAGSLAPVAGADWFVVAYDDGSPPLVFRDDEATGTVLSLYDAWSTLWDTNTGTFWERRWDDRGQPVRVIEEMSLDGRPTGRTIDTRGVWPRLADPAGGLILGDGSVGTFRVQPGGEAQRLPDGYVIAAGLGHLLMYACSENFDSCAMSVVDRVTGEARPVPIEDDEAIELVASAGWFAAPSGPRVNADGSGAIMSRNDGNGVPQWVVVDLVTGATTTKTSETMVDGMFAYPNGAWSADGRFAYLVAGETLVAVDHRTGDMFDVILDEDAPAVRAVTSRPA